MKKITAKLWLYGTNFFLRSIIFNLIIVFSIISIVYAHNGMTKWAVISITLLSLWVAMIIVGHLLWWKMTRQERILYFAIRRFGKRDKALVSKKEVNRKFGQSEMVSLLSDVDRGIEIQMAVNGAFTIVNIFIGFNWLRFAIDFHKDPSVFTYQLSE